MGKGYIYDENGNLEVQDYSVDAAQERKFCTRCKDITWHVHTAMSSTQGQLWTCLDCGKEEPC